MGTPLSSPTTTFVPGVKFRAIGDYIDVAIFDLKPVPWKDFVTKEVKVGDDGKPRTQDLVTGIVIGGSATIKVDDTERAVNADESVSLYFAGHHRWEFVQAQKALDGGLQVGDVLRVKYDRDEPSKAGNPKKVWTVQIRRAKPDEAARSARCEELRAGAATPLDDGPDPESEPF